MALVLMMTLWDWLRDTSVYTLATALPPAACRSRLEAQVFPRDWTVFSRQPIPSERPLRGTVGENGFKITRLHVMPNSFQVWAEGSFVANEDRTRIRVRFQMPAWPIGLVGCCWIIPYSGLLLLVIIGVLFRGIVSGSLIVLALLAAVVLIGIWTYAQARRTSRQDRCVLLGVLKQTLDATISEGREPAGQ